jgi:hypothetical protein
MPATAKISVSIAREELRQAKQLAGRLGLSLSTFISDAVRQRIEAQARKHAGLEVLATFALAELPSQEEMRDLLASWSDRSGARRAKIARKRAADKSTSSKGASGTSSGARGRRRAG